MWDKIEAINVFDETKNHRYYLYRKWQDNKPKATIVMNNPARLNPNPFRLGSTLTKIFEFIEEDYGIMEVVNLYPMVSAKKNEIKKERYFDKKNFTFIKDAVTNADTVILFWGKDSVTSKNKDFISLLSENSDKLKCFRLTKSGQPDYILSLTKEVHRLQKCFINNRGKFEINE
ncbi:DUF1643 domain-containing protein [Brevibacillus ginsengisoli]|uniref:DUF1643 domain-containing protein n=1 Tax=Brevibacillus ginsengisoli TaxID=363854 RepID=UPI003CF4E626